MATFYTKFVSTSHPLTLTFESCRICCHAGRYSTMDKENIFSCLPAFTQSGTFKVLQSSGVVGGCHACMQSCGLSIYDKKYIIQSKRSKISLLQYTNHKLTHEKADFKTTPPPPPPQEGIFGLYTAFTLAKKSVSAQHGTAGFVSVNASIPVVCRSESCCADPLYKSELTRYGTTRHRFC